MGHRLLQLKRKHQIRSFIVKLLLCFGFLACSLLVWLSDSATAEFSAHVGSVLDGDTIEVLRNQHPERIRLSGIDCPEKGQAYGQRAKQAASVLLFGKEVTIQTHGRDRYGRTIGDVILSDGTNVNHTLVKDGWCRWYRKYAPGDTVLKGLEKDAREAKKGLWVDPHPVPPWVYRKIKRGSTMEAAEENSDKKYINEMS
jgi:endonuclease YncB( thermonuclease family)